ncbi:hypothetical protein GOBAR_DD35752 [Gossypium barbadense]|nr:hypothetical protein GOBAR_DD35752 [Gossypium barbadense]
MRWAWAMPWITSAHSISLQDDSFIVGFGIGEGLSSSFSYILGCLTGTDRWSTAGNLTGGGRHRRPGMRWAWAMPWITSAHSISLPPKELKKLGQCATRRHTCV